MRFFIRTGPGVPNASAPDYWVTIDFGQERPRFTTGGHQYFDLDGAKEFCQKIADGEIDPEAILMEFATEDMAKEQATIREITEKSKQFQEGKNADQ